MSGYEDLCEVLDATSERLRHARRAGLGAGQQDIYLPSGMPSGVKYRRIERPLATALRHRWITPEQDHAGNEFLRHMVCAGAQLGFTTSRWKEVVDSSPVRDPMERKRFHERQFRAALLSIHYPECREPFWNWMAKTEQEDTSIAELGAKFTRYADRNQQKALGVYILGRILQDLAFHFGYVDRPTSWETRRMLEHILDRNNRQWR